MSAIGRTASRVCMLGEEPGWIEECERHAIDGRLELYRQFQARVVGDDRKVGSDLRDFVALLESMEIRRLVIGGVAVSGEERGTYEIDGTVLTLVPEGGEARGLTTYPYDDGSEGAQPRRMFFGGGMLKRQDQNQTC